MRPGIRFAFFFHEESVMGLRGKLVLGFGGLLVIMVAVSVLAAVVLHRYSETTDRVLREDLASVVAAHRMRNSIELLDDGLSQSLRGQAAPQVENQIAMFDDALHAQQAHVSVPEEREATERLARLWQRYKLAYEDFVKAVPAERSAVYDGRLGPL